MVFQQSEDCFLCSTKSGDFAERGTAIQILDRDDARQELTTVPSSGDTIINSQVAKDNSQINKSNNK